MLLQVAHGLEFAAADFAGELSDAGMGLGVALQVGDLGKCFTAVFMLA